MAHVNAPSLLLQNTAAPMYKEGSLQCMSFNYGASWKEFIGNPNLVSVGNHKIAFRGPLAKGSYSFLNVCDRLDLKHFPYMRVDNSTGVGSRARIR